MEGPYKSSSTYRKPAILAYASTALFACLALMSLFLAILGFSYALFHRDLYSGGETGSLSFVFALIAVFVNLEPYVRVIALILFLCWVYRVHKNLSALKVRGLEFTPGWAVAMFLIPLLNLFRPFFVLREIWHGSDPENEDNNKDTRARKGTPELLGGLWSVLIATIITTAVSNGLAGNEKRGENTFYPAALVLSELLRFGLMILIILVIKEISRRQEERYQKMPGLSSRSDAFPPPPPAFDGQA
jgi:hypothetical protein